MSICSITISSDSSKKLKAGYPWVFQNDILNPSVIEVSENGDIAHVHDQRGNFVCTALIDKNSKLKLRSISAEKLSTIDIKFFSSLIQNALNKRISKYSEPFYRLLNYEGDYTPGLAIDRFGDTFKITTQLDFYKNHSSSLLEAILQLFKPKAVVLEYNGATELLYGDLEDKHILIENGIKFSVDLISGQKTGWYYDQRENRMLIQNISHAHNNVLDVFCYSGGFGMNALKGGAKSVCFIDSSKDAINLVKTNISINALGAQNYIVDDALKAMQKLIDQCISFDLIILDPPPLIQNKTHKTQAVAKYKKIAKLGIQLLSENGKLLYSTCSHHMTSSDLRKVLSVSASDVGVKITELSITNHAADHPIHPRLPETLYLNSILIQNNTNSL